MYAAGTRTTTTGSMASVVSIFRQNQRWSPISKGRFDGTWGVPRHWLRMCEKYFKFYAIPEEEKSDLASLYMDQKSETWYNSSQWGKVFVPWAEFKTAVLEKYENHDRGHVVGSFKRLRQRGSAADYTTAFEELRVSMLERRPTLDTEYFMDEYIHGLNDDIRLMVQHFNPQTLQSLYRIAEREEKRNESLRQGQPPPCNIQVT